jgi:methylmalonyl-CoA/ethylmalonyl-CoA epimerase
VSTVRFDHIAIATYRMADAPEVLVGALGGAPAHGGPADVFHWGTWRYANGARLEVIEPRGADGFLHRFLRSRGPGIHHVTFRVPSLDEACARAAARGYTIVGYDNRDPVWGTAFLHPRQALGIVVQFAEVRRVPGRPRPAWQHPPGPASPPPPVSVLGLEMRARSAERARVQWQEILEGEAVDAGPARVAYRWPGSPMGLTIDLDPAAEEGPVAIAYAADRPVALPAGPVPRLGAVFVRRPPPGGAASR